MEGWIATNFGGNGYGGIEPSHFTYTSSVFDIDGWSELTESNPPAERKGLGSAGPYNFNGGDTICLDVAFTTAFSYDTLLIDSIPSAIFSWNATEVLKSRVNDINNFYNTNFPECGITYITNSDFVESVSQEILLGAKIFPNPATQYISIETGRYNTSSFRFQLINVTGETVATYSGNKEIENIHVADLPAGYYLVEIYSDEVLIARSNFIKQ